MARNHRNRSIEMSDKLTPKQQRFVQEYLIDLNGTQAAIRAGYSERTANEQASRLLAKINIKSALAERQKKIADKTELTAQWVLDQLRIVAKRCMQTEPVLDRKGDPVYVETPEGTLVPAFTFQAVGAARALELIGKHLEMFTETHKHTGKIEVEHKVVDSIPFDAIRKRAETQQQRSQSTTH